MAWPLAGLLLAAIAVAGGAILWSHRLDLFASIAARLLERDGLGPAQLAFDRVDLHGLHARDIKLLGGAVAASELTLVFTPAELLAKHLREATVAGLHATLAIENGAVTLGGKPLGASISASGSSPVGGLRIDSLKIDDGRLALDRREGRVEAAFSTTLALAGADLPNASFAVDVTLPIAGSRHGLHIAVPVFALAPRPDGGLALHFETMRITLRDLPWDATDIGGDILWQPDRLTLKLGSGRLVNRRQPALVQPLRFSGTAAMAGTRIDFALHVDAEAAGSKGKIALDAKGHHDSASGDGSASISMAPARFQTTGLQPADFFPVLHGMLAKIAGSAAATGSLRWRGTTLSPDLVVRLADVEAEPSGARISKANGAINFVALWPPATPAGQVLNATVEAGGLPPSEATLIFQLLPKPALSVEALLVAFAGGRISTTPFVIDPAVPRIDTVLKFEHVDLAEVFKLIGIDGLDGTGRLDGDVPLVLTQERVRIGEGKLAASGPGVLHFRSERLPKEITEAGDSVKLALQAMADFHYDSLVAALAETETGDGTIVLRLRGNNPAVLDGRLFNFNIKFESNFDRLTALALQSTTMAEDLLRRTEGSLRQ